jgi:hypothetical protein
VTASGSLAAKGNPQDGTGCEKKAAMRDNDDVLNSIVHNETVEKKP